ncbi:MAG: DUF721 domain-containing protein [Gaiellales bacterium]
MSAGRRRDPQSALRMPASIGSDIAGSMPGDLGPVRRIADVWADVVGEGLARVAQPARIARDGTLIVHAADASWVHALTLEERTILRKLDERMAGDGPPGLKVEIGPISVPAAAVQYPPIVIQPAAQARADELTAAVTDPALRASLNRAIALSLSRQG